MLYFALHHSIQKSNRDNDQPTYHNLISGEVFFCSFFVVPIPILVSCSPPISSLFHPPLRPSCAASSLAMHLSTLSIGQPSLESSVLAYAMMMSATTHIQQDFSSPLHYTPWSRCRGCSSWDAGPALGRELRCGHKKERGCRISGQWWRRIGWLLGRRATWGWLVGTFRSGAPCGQSHPQRSRCLVSAQHTQYIWTHTRTRYMDTHTRTHHIWTHTPHMDTRARTHHTHVHTHVHTYTRAHTHICTPLMG